MSINEQQLALIIESTVDFVATTNLNGYITYINPSGRKMLGLSKEIDISNYKIYDFYPEWACTLISNEAIPIALQNGFWSGESVFLKLSGEEISIFQTILAHKKEDGTVEFLSIIGRDISYIKNIENTAYLFSKIFESTQEGIIITDKNNNIQSVNSAFSVVTGYSPNEVIGKNPRILKSGLHTTEFYKNLWDILNNLGQWQGEIWNRRKNGEIYLEWVNINIIKDLKGSISNYVAIFSDITSLKISESQLSHLAHHDPLTGLPNRLLFQDRLQQVLTQSQYNKKIIAVLFIDLDKFKPINDNFGHRVGDQLLQAVAERLMGCMREGDTIARLGGDEFIAIVRDISTAQDSAKVAQKILDILSQPFLVEGHKLHIAASIGISLYPSDATNIDELVRNADFAMYMAKKHGGNSFEFYLKPA